MLRVIGGEAAEMVFDKTCPGARTIREPMPEFINCPDCGREVEIWTDELKATCSACGGKVFRAAQASCIDWCPHAKECVGPEVYEKLRPGVEEDLPGDDSTFGALTREHERIREIIGILKGASLCLKMGTRSPHSEITDRGLEQMLNVVEFFEKTVGPHFRREEEVLFPALEKHIGRKTSPTHLLLKEHAEILDLYHDLQDGIADARRDDATLSEEVSGKIQSISARIGRLMTDHIKRENEMLFPLATKLFDKEELDGISRELRTSRSTARAG